MNISCVFFYTRLGNLGLFQTHDNNKKNQLRFDTSTLLLLLMKLIIENFIC